ncbi:hypothetical protein CPC08DRAFT_771459 [Agrocybe pediades]|nr:hypothetical protein CPC08DRAFT_771459 [Agrocybe pediades]
MHGRNGPATDNSHCPLVWRCFHACGGSFYKSLLPIGLLIVETGLALVAMVYGCLTFAKPAFNTAQNGVIYNRLAAATFVAVAATSLVSTVVICLQIWRRTTPSSRSRKRYQTVISALIESSATYSGAALVLAISTFALNTGGYFTALLIENFVDAATLNISGLAPTLMITRLVMSSGREDAEVSSEHLSSALISYPLHSNGTTMSSDVEVHKTRSRGVEQEGEVIQIVPTNGHEVDDDRQGRLETIANGA